MGTPIPYLAIYGITLSQTFAVERRYRRARQHHAFGYHLAIGLEAGLIGHFVFGIAGSYGDSYYAYLLLGLAVMLIRYHRENGPEAVLR